MVLNTPIKDREFQIKFLKKKKRARPSCILYIENAQDMTSRNENKN